MQNSQQLQKTSAGLRHSSLPLIVLILRVLEEEQLWTGGPRVHPDFNLTAAAEKAATARRREVRGTGGGRGSKVPTISAKTL